MTDFGWALARLREGMKVTRNGWERPGLYVRLQLDYKRSEARALVYEPRLMLHSPDGDPAEWVPVGSDLFAQDWLCASSDGTITWPDGTTDADTLVKDAFPEKVADDMPWLMAGWSRPRYHPVDKERSAALLRDVAESFGFLGDIIKAGRERSLMDDLPARLHPLAAAVGIPDRPVDPRERAREWIVGFYATTDEDRVNCVALLLGAADDALRCAVNHKGRDEGEQGQG